MPPIAKVAVKLRRRNTLALSALLPVMAIQVMATLAWPVAARAGEAHRASSPAPAQSAPSILPQLPALPASGARTTDIQPWAKAPTSAAPAASQLAEFTPRVFTTTPRELGPQYFQRWSYSGPSHRGRAYNVKPLESN